MDRSQTQFLELLRAGLWGTAAEPDNFKPGSVDWRAVLRIAKEQTMAVVVADGIETLPQELWPPKEIMLRLMMLRVKTGQMHALLNSTIVQIVRALDAEGVPSVLLKGQGVARNYLKPESRTCGDIDLYTGLEGYEKACQIISRLSKKDPASGVEADHHMHLSLNGVEVEVHRMAGYMPGRKDNSSFQKWTQDSIDAHFAAGDLPLLDYSGTPVCLASPTFDAFFILHHAVRHMTTEGVGFRQICDWTMYIHKHHAQIDCAELQRRLKEYGMETVWREFSVFAVRILGLPASELPVMPDRFESRKTSKILGHIFASGNFGRFDVNPKDHSEVPYLKRKWRSFRYQTARLFKLYPLFPRYISSYMWHWSTGAFNKFIQQKDKD
jgi:hypothetical protein